MLFFVIGEIRRDYPVYERAPVIGLVVYKMYNRILQLLFLVFCSATTCLETDDG